MNEITKVELLNLSVQLAAGEHYTYIGNDGMYIDHMEKVLTLAVGLIKEQCWFLGIEIKE